MEVDVARLGSIPAAAGAVAVTVSVETLRTVGNTGSVGLLSCSKRLPSENEISHLIRRARARWTRAR